MYNVRSSPYLPSNLIKEVLKEYFCLENIPVNNPKKKDILKFKN